MHDAPEEYHWKACISKVTSFLWVNRKARRGSASGKNFLQIMHIAPRIHCPGEISQCEDSYLAFSKMQNPESDNGQSLMPTGPVNDQTVFYKSVVITLNLKFFDGFCGSGSFIIYFLS
jgi:hypothetical protein